MSPSNSSIRSTWFLLTPPRNENASLHQSKRRATNQRARWS
jgi:hypothetical protein